MRLEKQKGKTTVTEKTSNELDATEVVSESTETESPEQHFEADGSQIDDEGQSHNIDDAVQYVDETDTVDPPRRPTPPNDQDTNSHIPQVVNHSVEYLSPTTEEVLVNEPNRIIVPDEEEEVGADSQDHREVDNRQFVSSTVAPPAKAIGQANRRPPRPNTVHVESERVEVIEIKSDGSSGHLSHFV